MADRDGSPDKGKFSWLPLPARAVVLLVDGECLTPVTAGSLSESALVLVHGSVKLAVGVIAQVQLISNRTKDRSSDHLIKILLRNS